jgi:DNA-binding transcriptional LysR family regulator
VGVAQIPTMMIGDALDRGELIDVLPGWAPKSHIVHAVFPSRRGLLPSVRALLDFLAEEYAAVEAADGVRV